MMTSTPIRLTIPASADHLDIVRAALYAIAGKAGFSYEEIEDMKVAVTEACSNAILHAYAGIPTEAIHISFMQEEHRLIISVKDYGRSFELAETKGRSSTLHDKPLAIASVGGLGIFLMQALMDEVEVRTGEGTEVVLIKRMSRSEEMV